MRSEIWSDEAQRDPAVAVLDAGCGGRLSSKAPAVRWQRGRSRQSGAAVQLASQMTRPDRPARPLPCVSCPWPPLPAHFARRREPKVLLTTCYKPSGIMYAFLSEMLVRLKQ